MEKWTDTQNFADAGEKSTLIASAHRAAIRSIERVVTETVTPHDPLYAAEGIEKMLRTGGVLALTGAGVSTESGIPDYRGPSGSLLDHRPMTYQEFRYDDAAPTTLLGSVLRRMEAHAPRIPESCSLCARRT